MLSVVSGAASEANPEPDSPQGRHLGSALPQPTQMQQATQKTLKKLSRKDTVIEVRQMPGGAVKLHISDPVAQAAVKAALKDLKEIEGKDAAGDALNKLLQKMPTKMEGAK